MSAISYISYLQFRRGLREYYRHESDDAKKQLFSRKKSKWWQEQHRLYTKGYRGGIISDATAAVMLQLKASS